MAKKWDENDEPSSADYTLLKSKYEAFRKSYEEWERNYHGSLQTQQKILEDTFSYLERHIRRDLCGPLVKSRKWLGNIIRNVVEYRKRGEDLKDFAHDEFRCLGHYGRTVDLDKNAELINKFIGLTEPAAHEMMTNLLEVVQGSNERSKPKALRQTV